MFTSTKLGFIHLRALLLISIVEFFLFCGSALNAAEWQGYQKVDLKVGERDAFLIVPKTSATGKPWIWRTEFFGHEPQADLALLENGFHVAYIDMQNRYGAPSAIQLMNAFYAEVTRSYGLSRKTVLEGFSRGGLFALNWAAENPDKVACIYNDAPVCDFKSWPAAKGKAKGSPADWERLKAVYGFVNEDAAVAYKLNPIDNLAPLARAKIPLLHVCGETDDVVPIDENSRIVERRYRELGGSITMIVKPNCNHHPHSLKDPTRIVNFVLENTGFADRVRPAQTPYGYDYFYLRGGLSRCREVFLREKKGRVAFLGGSITAAPGWRDLVCEDLQRRFPETKFDFINAGISSLGSTPGAFRFQRHVLAQGTVDLLFEEAAVNDDTNQFSGIEQIRGMEGIVRHALISNPRMDVVLLHFVDPGKIAEINLGKTPDVIANHEKVATHYQIPSIDLAHEVTDRIHAGEFTWEKDFRDLHPSPFGHGLYFNAIKRMFDKAWNDSAPQNINGEARVLPAPLDIHSYFAGHLVNPKDAVESGAVSLNNGWSLDPNWKPKDKAGVRAGFVEVPMLVATEPGSTFRFKFKGRAVGLFVVSGPDTGRVEFRVDDGGWQSQHLFTSWSGMLHLPWAKMLASDLSPGDHVIELKVSDGRDALSQGHAVRIAFFLVNDSEPTK